MRNFLHSLILIALAIISHICKFTHSFKVNNIRLSFLREKRNSRVYAGMAISGRRRSPPNSKTAKIKQLKASRALQDELYDILMRCDFNMRSFPIDDLVRGIGFSDVVTSPDLSFANVFVTVPGNAVQKRQMFSWLCENIGSIRHALRQRLRHWRVVPTIMFKLVELDEVSEVLAEISSERKKDNQLPQT